MIFDKHIGLTDEKSIHVEIYTIRGKKLGFSQINISPGKLPSLNLKIGTDISKIKSNTVFRCKSEDGWYTLIDCSIVGYQIYPRLIINSEKRNGYFRKISILFKGLSEWMNNSEPCTHDNNTFSKNIDINSFQTHVNDENLGIIRISSENWWETSSRDSSIFTLTQYSMITLESIDKRLKSDQLIEKIYEIRAILSLLTGHKIDIEYVLDRSTKRNTNSIYFANSFQKSVSFDNKINCIIPSALLFRENKFEMVFKNLYEKNYDIFKKTWSRLSGCLDKGETWEYEFLSHVSTLDSYTNIHTKNIGKKISKNQFKNIKRKLIEQLEDLSKGSSDAKYEFVISSIAKQIGIIRNSTLVTFQDRIDYCLENTSPAILESINLNTDQLNHIKDIRNKIAHGDIPKTKHSYDLTYESILKSKLMVLLLYWFYRDVGFTDFEIAGFFKNFTHPIMRRAYLRESKLNEIRQDDPILPVTKHDINKIKSDNILNHIFECKGPRRNLAYVQHTSKEVNRLFYNGKATTKYRYIEELIGSLIDSSSIKKILYIGNAYAKNNTDTHKLYSVCILNPSKNIISSNPLQRCWYHDDTTKEWIQEK